MKEKIAVHADVDFDGVTSAAIIYNFLKQYTNNICYFHAQRRDGHGIYLLKDKIPEGTELLIIVDSSSNEVDTCKELSERGIEVIIIDHHTIETKNEYCTLVNPQQEGCSYPNKNASGALITWKVCQVLEDRLGGDICKNLIDLVGTGVHSDQMSMLEPENRYVVNEALNNIKNIGLKSALKVIGLNESKLNATEIAFFLSPLINAATRLDKIELILQLFTSEDPEECEKLAKALKKLNNERKKKQAEAIDRILPTIDPSDKCVVVLDTTLGKGFNGLIAGDLANQLQKPVIVLGEPTDEEKSDEYHGSFRSIGSFNMLDFVSSIPEALFAGGHPAAGGTGIKKCDLESFRKSLNDGLSNRNLENVLYYELEIDLKEIDESVIKEIKKLYKVNGQNFKEARFLIKNIFISDKQELGGGSTVKAYTDKVELLKFRAPKGYYDHFPVFSNIDVIGTLNMNEFTQWKPYKKIIKSNQIFIDAYRISK
ncbi:DHH family phosphoesterase [Paenibacillus ehimensis]|uniref:DHH family phosphoesterase n=1 Tax=Paenibacillus ehimensis TaxID=79264 RepID=UPI002DBBB4CB|nr:DHH family phosphoesterase [Paenibacillus ehimensis]MEC0209688.1 DHH family phosphoesterase [Paenibacillus ehimensis]